VSDAVRVVRSQGFTPYDTDDYGYPDFNYGLHVIIGYATGSADGYTQRAFSFVHGQYIATDLADPSATIQIVWRDDTTIRVRLHNLQAQRRDVLPARWLGHGPLQLERNPSAGARSHPVRRHSPLIFMMAAPMRTEPARPSRCNP
jgi:LppP/LprE lipoprotein